MKKVYEKPILDIIEFNLNENIMVDLGEDTPGGSLGTEIWPDEE